MSPRNRPTKEHKRAKEADNTKKKKGAKESKRG
jgi:hypothetical protein